MKIFVELEPTGRAHKFEEWLESIKGLVDGVHIPDSPLGVPRTHPLALSVLAMKHGISPTCHLRLMDINKVAFISLIRGALVLSIKRLLFVRGDPPKIRDTTVVTDLTTEDAIKFVKKELKLKELIVGATLNVKFSMNKILKRLESGADFYLAMHCYSPEDISDELLKELKVRNAKLYSYFIVETKKNRGIIRSFLKDLPINYSKNMMERFESFDGLVDGLVVTSPGDFEGSLNVLRSYARR